MMKKQTSKKKIMKRKTTKKEITESKATVIGMTARRKKKTMKKSMKNDTMIIGKRSTKKLEPTTNETQMMEVVETQVTNIVIMKKNHPVAT